MDYTKNQYFVNFFMKIDNWSSYCTILKNMWFGEIPDKFDKNCWKNFEELGRNFEKIYENTSYK